MGQLSLLVRSHVMPVEREDKTLGLIPLFAIMASQSDRLCMVPSTSTTWTSASWKLHLLLHQQLLQCVPWCHQSQLLLKCASWQHQQIARQLCQREIPGCVYWRIYNLDVIAVSFCWKQSISGEVISTWIQHFSKNSTEWGCRGWGLHVHRPFIYYIYVVESLQYSSRNTIWF